MIFSFRSAETVFPDLIDEKDNLTSSEIVETAYDGCAWCGTGEGCCAQHLSAMFAQSLERKTNREVQ